MNVNDADVVWSILSKAGYLKTETLEDADIILLITCSIRENAENKIWNRLFHLNKLKKNRIFDIGLAKPKVGLLGEW